MNWIRAIGRMQWTGGWQGAASFAVVFAVSVALITSAPAFREAVGDVITAESVAEISDGPIVTAQGFTGYQGSTEAASAQVVEALAAIPNLEDPTVTLTVGTLDTRASTGDFIVPNRVVVVSRAGAIDALDVVEDTGVRGGVFLPMSLADQLGLLEDGSLATTPGALSFTVSDRTATLDVVARGVYRDIDPGDPPPYWQDLPLELLPTSFRVFGGRVEPLLLVVEPADFFGLVSRVQQRPDAVTDIDADDTVIREAAQGRIWWQADLSDGLEGVVELRELASAIRVFDRSITDVFVPLGGAVAAGEIDGLVVRTSVFDLNRDIDDAIDRIGPAINSVSIAATAVGLLVVVVGAWFIAGRRRRELSIWSIEGRSPVAIATAASLGSVPSAVVGGIAGTAIGPRLTQLLGPSELIHPEAATPLLVTAFVVAGLLAVGLVTGRVASRILRPTTSRRPRWVWDLALYGAAAVLLIQALLRNDRTDPEGLDLLSLAVPIVGIAAIVALGMRLVSLAMHGARRRGKGFGVALFLAWRRISFALSNRLGIVFPVGIAAGIVLFSASLVTSVESTIDAKATVTVGADSGLRLAGLVRYESLPPGATLVRVGTTSLQTGRSGWMIIIDPDQYESAVDWDDSFGMTQREFLDAMAPRPDRPVAAVVAGPNTGTIPAEGSARFQSLSIGFERVGTTEAIPLMSELRPTLAVRSDTLIDWLQRHPEAVQIGFDAGDGPVDPNQLVAEPDLEVLLRGMSRIVVANEDVQGLEASFLEIGQGVREVRFKADIVSDPAFSAQKWGFDYLQIVALISLAMAFVVFGFSIIQRRHSMVVAEALTTRMGIRRSANGVADALETLMLTTVAMALGAFAALILGWLAIEIFDPLPKIRPLLSLQVSGQSVGLLAGSGALLSFAVWGLGRRATATADTAEVFRG